MAREHGSVMRFALEHEVAALCARLQEHVRTELAQFLDTVSSRNNVEQNAGAVTSPLTERHSLGGGMEAGKWHHSSLYPSPGAWTGNLRQAGSAKHPDGEWRNSLTNSDIPLAPSRPSGQMSRVQGAADDAAGLVQRPATGQSIQRPATGQSIVLIPSPRTAEEAFIRNRPRNDCDGPNKLGSPRDLPGQISEEADNSKTDTTTASDLSIKPSACFGNYLGNMVEHSDSEPSDAVPDRSSQRTERSMASMRSSCRTEDTVITYYESTNGRRFLASSARELDSYRRVTGTRAIGGRVGARQGLYQKSRISILLEQEKDTLRAYCAKVITSPVFDYLTCFLVVLNACSIGWQVDYAASNINDNKVPLHFTAMEYVFCVCFSAEVVLRLYVLRCGFWCGKQMAWNWFDLLMVLLQLVDVLAFLVNPVPESEESSDNEAVGANLEVLKMLQMLRLIRILRLIRLVRFIGELRKIVYLIMGSIWSFFWTLMLISLMIYLVAVFLTQLVTDYRKDTADPPEDGVQKHFGNLGVSILSLFQSISGGVDWGDILDPLMTEISPLLSMLYAIYIAFVVMVMLNLVTGVFVEGAARIMKQDREQTMMKQMIRIFAEDLPNGEEVSWHVFEKKLESPLMQDFFKALDVDLSEAKTLFDILSSKCQEFSPLEFVSQGLNLQRPAKAIDMAMLYSHQSAMYDELQECTKNFKNALRLLQSTAQQDGTGLFDLVEV